MATTFWPTLSWLELPSSATGSLGLNFDHSQISIGSRPINSPAISLPSGRKTLSPRVGHHVIVSHDVAVGMEDDP